MNLAPISMHRLTEEMVQVETNRLANPAPLNPWPWEFVEHVVGRAVRQTFEGVLIGFELERQDRELARVRALAA